MGRTASIAIQVLITLAVLTLQTAGISAEAVVADAGTALMPIIVHEEATDRQVELATELQDYLNRITDVHARIDELLAAPKSQWPEREDGKLHMLRAAFEKAAQEVVASSSVENNGRLEQAKAELEKYMSLIRQGGY